MLTHPALKPNLAAEAVSPHIISVTVKVAPSVDTVIYCLEVTTPCKYEVD